MKNNKASELEKISQNLEFSGFDAREVDSSKNEKLIQKELELMVKDIWKKYDRDNNGVLDKDEIKNFVADVLNDVNLEQKSPSKNSSSCNLDINDIFD